MTNFWQKLSKPFFILAPMEAVTDVVFRHVVKQAGAPDIFFSEFEPNYKGILAFEEYLIDKYAING